MRLYEIRRCTVAEMQSILVQIIVIRWGFYTSSADAFTCAKSVIVKTEAVFNSVSTERTKHITWRKSANDYHQFEQEQRQPENFKKLFSKFYKQTKQDALFCMYLFYTLFATLHVSNDYFVHHQVGTSSNRKTEQLGTFALFVQSCRYSKFMNS